MRIASGPARVIGAGVATTFGGHPLVLALEVDGEPLVIELVFSDDPACDGPAVISEPTAHGFRLGCVNFDDGRGTAEPMLVRAAGDQEQDLVFLHFHAFRYRAAVDTTVQYTVFRVAKVDVGWTPIGG